MYLISKEAFKNLHYVALFFGGGGFIFNYTSNLFALVFISLKYSKESVRVGYSDSNHNLYLKISFVLALI